MDHKRRRHLELRINTPKLEIPLILGGTGQRFRACGGEGGTFSDLMAGKADCLKQLNVSLDTTSYGSRLYSRMVLGKKE